MCTDVTMVRSQAKKLAEMIKEKTLDAHPDKSGIVILGSKRFKSKIKDELKKEPIRFNNFDLKIKTEDKYLGQMIESDLSTSALATVLERSGKIKGAGIEVKQIIEDFEMKTNPGRSRSSMGSLGKSPHSLTSLRGWNMARKYQ